MSEPDRIPLWVRLKAGERPSFIKMDGEWYVVGEMKDLPVSEEAGIRRMNGDLVEVRVVEHLRWRRVKHRSDTEWTEYVIARFE